MSNSEENIDLNDSQTTRGQDQERYNEVRYLTAASTPLPLHPFLAAFFPKGAFFKLFFTLELVQQLCNFTNEYMEATKHLRPSLAKNWNKLTPDEFHIFIGLLIYFSIVKLLRLELY
ncbi:hypothetical protein RRG08_052261 [Elysia crispata]|uniref:PiggyBac transposable element-derived protein domain-containing protein n=1 Tax=Elysia crispata TaxID=231223 RepID=A0AAE0ZZF2_9GAST|nr:hypothetical protein RRG08_052261 [Elysia crispata]